jgi:chromosome partitioning protein
MKVLAVVGQKGGVGKSTVAINLAVVAEEAGEKALLIDLDPQGSALLWAELRATNKPSVVAAQPERLAGIIKAAEEFAVTLVVVDAPSRLDSIALGAIRAADVVITPAMPDLINLAPLRDTAALIEQAEKLDATIAVVNNADNSKRVDEARAELRKLGLAIAPTVLLHSPQFATAYGRGKGVVELGDGKAGVQVRALWSDLEKFARRVSAPKRNGKAKEARA